MREFINIIESESMLTLQSVASFLAEVNDDVLPDELLEVDWSEAPDEACLNLIRRVFMHGSCGDFAYAVHEKHGWPIIRFMGDNGGVHYACKTPDGLFFDIDGKVSLETIKKRHRFKRVQIAEADPDECLMDSNDDDEWSSVQLARFVLGKIT